MRIKNLQQALREAGRIRIGYSTPSAKKAGVKVPHQLDRFRFTSDDAAAIHAVAAAYGGTVEPWPDGGKDQWQVTTDVNSLNVVWPAGIALWQCYEQYAGGFPVRRCDGARYMTPGRNGRMTDEGPCACDPDNRDCSLTTALNVLLPDLAGISTWRAVTHSWWSAIQLIGAGNLIESHLGPGMSVPGRLFITQRTRRALVDGKPTTKHFPVLSFDLQTSVAALVGGGGSGGPSRLPGTTSPGAGGPPALPAGEGWAPVDEQALAPAPLATVADQLAEVDRPRRRRANAAPPVPSTGRQPRTAAEAAEGAPQCSACGLPYGTAPLVRNPVPGGSRFIHDSCAKAGAENGETQGDQPPPGTDARDGGGNADGAALGPADPASVAGAPQGDTLSNPQYAKLGALGSEIWPCHGLTGREAADYRRAQILRLCTVLGAPGLTSRKQITREMAGPLLDVLAAMKDGTLALTDSGLVDCATGNIVLAVPE